MFARVAAAAAVISLVFAPAAVAGVTAPSTLSVDGSGSVFLTPDVASLSLSVASSAVRSSAALSAANARVRSVVEAVRAAGVSAAGIQTESIDVSKGIVRVGPRNHKRNVERFTATESLSVTAATTIIGNVIDRATRAGANSIDGPQFSFSDPSAGMVAATNAALADARRRADAAAATLGYTVTGVQSVDLNPGQNLVPGSGSSSAPSASPQPATPTTIHPGTEEIDALVAVVYTIAPA